MFTLIKSVDFIAHTRVRELFLDIILYSPLLLPFFRFGVPVFLQQNIHQTTKRKHLENVFLFQVFLLILIHPVFLIDRHIYIILVVSVCAAMLFNLGSYLIRKGERNGFLMQNGLFNLCMLGLASAFIYFNEYQNAKLYIGVICLFLASTAFYFINPDEFRYSCKRIPNIKIYILDTLSTFFIPLVTLLAVKLASSTQTDLLILIKISAFISGTVGSLILLRIKRLDDVPDSERMATYNKIKMEQLKMLLLLSTFGFAASYLFVPSLAGYFVLFIVFEITLLRFGQMNILLNYNSQYKRALAANCVSAFIGISLFALLFLVVDTQSEIIPLFFYLAAIATFHLSCRVMAKKA